MKKSLLFLLIMSVLVSCNQHNKFKISGQIKNAEGKMLYFEHDGLLKTTTLDSAKLNANGEFSFKALRPEYPDFYSLKLDGKTITFAVDSSEVMTINSQDANFATDYTVTGSTESAQIQKLRKSVMNIQIMANNLTNNLSSEERNEKIAEIQKKINEHKEMAQKLILENPRSTAAYFALYQKINNTYLFSPYIKSDKPYCAAVATAFNTFMPEYERSKNIYGLVMDAIKTERKAKENEAWQEVLEQSGKGYIDIDLKNNKNEEKKLSSLEGKVVLIDFSAYESENSVDYTFALRDLYNKYHSKGFEIYQVSLDQSKLLWEQSVENIPWICVRDDNGPNSIYVSTYNLSAIPTAFLMNKQGNIISRSQNPVDLKKDIEKSL